MSKNFQLGEWNASGDNTDALDAAKIVAGAVPVLDGIFGLLIAADDLSTISDKLDVRQSFPAEFQKFSDQIIANYPGGHSSQFVFMARQYEAVDSSAQDREVIRWVPVGIGDQLEITLSRAILRGAPNIDPKGERKLVIGDRLYRLKNSYYLTVTVFVTGGDLDLEIVPSLFTNSESKFAIANRISRALAVDPVQLVNTPDWLKKIRHLYTQSSSLLGQIASAGLREAYQNHFMQVVEGAARVEYFDSEVQKMYLEKRGLDVIGALQLGLRVAGAVNNFVEVKTMEEARKDASRKLEQALSGLSQEIGDVSASLASTYSRIEKLERDMSVGFADIDRSIRDLRDRAPEIFLKHSSSIRDFIEKEDDVPTFKIEDAGADLPIFFD